MHPLAIAADEFGDKVVPDLLGRTLDKFQLEAGHQYVSNHEVAFGVGDVRVPAGRRGSKVLREEFAGLANVGYGKRDVVKMYQPVGRRIRMRRVEVGHLPELNQRTERGSRRNERGRRARWIFLLIDDANSIAL